LQSCRRWSSESTASRCVFDLSAREREADELEKQTVAPGFWDDSQHAQTIMRRIAELRSSAEPWRAAAAKAGELLELAELSRDEDDDALAAELNSETRALEQRLGELEFELMLGGPYDANSAILSIHAGAGGTDSQDWAEMLLRMYLRWAERRRFSAEILNQTDGEEAGIKSVTVEITGRYAYGYLRSERGVHRLVRLSPYNSANARQTSFTLVEVSPDLGDDATDVEINADDLRVDVFNASGHGGQNVQKNATAIRITHLPTGKVVTCQNERSQHRNRDSAMKVLKAWLLEQELERQADERARLKGAHIEAGWGNQIRSYVLHPYKLVKDLRSGYESNDPSTILDGDLDPLMQAYLQWDVGNQGGAAA
jgi:peptide chain release factor 2